MSFDPSWLSLILLSLSWIAASKLYEPGAEWSIAYIAAAVLLGILIPGGPNVAGRKRGANASSHKEGGSSAPGRKNRGTKVSDRKRGSGDIRSFLTLMSRRLKYSVLQCAAMFAAQGAVFPFLYTVFAKYHKEPFITRLCAFLASLAGVKTASEGEYMLRLDAALAPISFSATWEKTGILIFSLILAGGAALLFLRRAGFRRYVGLFTLCATYLLLRYTALILIYCQYPIHNIFWERFITLVTFAPFAVILSRYFTKDGAGFFAKKPLQALKELLADAANQAPSIHKIPAAARRALSTALVISLSVFAFFAVAYFGLRDPGQAKSGRVVVDEFHSNWEWTDEAYDENWFGERSGYNYYCFYEYIDKFYETSRNTVPINGQTLSQADILIIKTPTEPFDADEVDAIYDFVGNGGGLYLIGDHTNVFGTGTNLNQIAPLFGIRFMYDCTYELTTGNLSEYDAPILMPHPVIRDLPHFLFATSNTLETTMFAEDVIIGYGLKTFQADYSQRNFFPENTNSGEIEFGAFIQSAATAYKRGRVLAFTDSTVFSNFWMHMRGKPELLLGALDWLNRENIFPVAPRQISLIMMLAAALTAIAVAVTLKAAAAAALAATPLIATPLAANASIPVKRRRLRHSATNPTDAPVQNPAQKPAFRARIIIYPIASLLVGVIIFSITAHIGNLPEPIKQIVNIRFENEYSDIKLPIDLNGFLADMDKQLSTFYVWTQRLGYVPSLSGDLRKALAGAATERSVAVVAKPKIPFSNEDELLKYVNDGAVLLILDSIEAGSHSNGLLKRVGMEIVAAEIQGTAEYADYAEYAPPPNAVDEISAVAMNDPLPEAEIEQAGGFETVISDIVPTRNASAVTGGAAMMHDEAGNALFSVMDIGLGRIAVFSDPDLFYNMELGDVSANLTPKTALLTRLEFELMKMLASK